MKTLFCLLLGAVALVLAACTDEPSTGLAAPTPVLVWEQNLSRMFAPVDTVEGLEDASNFWTRETFREVEGEMLAAFTFRQQTRHIFRAMNLLILNDLKLGPGLIQFDYLGIGIPRVLMDAFSPANSEVGIHVPNGVHQLRFRSEKYSDSYRMAVDSKAVRFTPVDTTWIRTESMLLWRHRPNTFAVWFLVSGADLPVITELLDSLQAALALEPVVFPPEGEAPFPLSHSGSFQGQPTPFFSYRDSGDFEQAVEITNRFAETHRPGDFWRGVTLINWTGEIEKIYVSMPAGATAAVSY